MSTTQVLHAAGSVRPVGFRTWVDRYFYFFMSLLAAVVVVYGFSHTISQALLHPGIRPPALLWVHGAVFFGWLGLFILQSALVRTRNVKVHKRLGWYFAGVGTAIPVLGVAITRVMSLFEINTRHYDVVERLGFLAIPLQDMVAFTAAFAPFQPMTLSFLSSSSSVAMKNFSSSSRIGFVRSSMSFKARSECERRGTANRRSFRSALLLPSSTSGWPGPRRRRYCSAPLW